MRILAVAVTYYPDASLLADVLRSVVPQVQDVAIIDNGSANIQDIRSLGVAIGAHVIGNEQNLGIAAAQNQGVALARENGFSHVLLLDQDTVLSPGVVRDLSKNLAILESDQAHPAAIGPAYREMNRGQVTKAYRADRFRISRLSIAGEKNPIASDFIIASGSLIPLAVLEQIGPFDENLFIDLVDVEWCFRAKAHGYNSFLSPTAAVEHHLGSGTVQLGTKHIAMHVPVRNYYWVRNALWLARQPHTTLPWRLYFISRSLAFLGAYTTLVDKRMLRLRLMCRGIRDSFSGRFGRLGQGKP